MGWGVLSCVTGEQTSASVNGLFYLNLLLRN